MGSSIDRPSAEYKALIERGLERLAAKEFDAALVHFDAAIALQPQFAVGHANRGAAHYRAGRVEEALAGYERATSLDPAFADALRNQGIILCELQRFDEALPVLDRAVALEPRDFKAIFRRGFALMQLKRLPEALADMDRVIALKPDYWPAQLNKGMWSLTMGDFETGLPLYELRWKHPGTEPARVPAGSPVWLGDAPIAGKRLLVTPEQGLGDFIQCCRYVPVLERMGVRVTLSAPRALIRLVRSISPDTVIHEHKTPYPPFDYVCPVGSLPLASRTTLSSIPPAPYLRVDESLVRSWAALLPQANRTRVGIAWSGNPKHDNDRNRSIRLDVLKAVFQAPVDFHVVQTLAPADRAHLQSFGNVHVHAIQDLADAGAIMESMDLVISVDTAAAHLAGSLARPLWLLLAFQADWRWMLDRDDSPWYPTATLYRQPRARDWASVLEGVRARLTSLR